MNSTPTLFVFGALALLTGGVLRLLGLSFSGRLWTRLSFGVTLLGILLIALGLGLRWIWYARTMDAGVLESFPVVTFYETVAFGGAVAAALTLRLGEAELSAAVRSLLGVVLLGLPLLSVRSDPVLFLPSLRSGWLAAHVALSFAAYAMYAVAAAVAAAYLFGNRDECRIALLRRLIGNGTLLFTVGGLVFGAVWAETSWGRFWAWDPKETWALVTWGVYVAWIHLDLRGRLTPKMLAIGALLGFSAVIFTYVGVNLWFAGLHSYATLRQM